MVVVANWHYQCGCGFESKLEAEAREHCRKTGHTVSGYAQIRESEPKPRKRAE